MKSIFRKLLLVLLTICSFGLANAQNAQLQIIIGEPDFSDGYGFTKNFVFTINNMDEDITIPSDVFLIDFSLPENVSIEYGSFIMPDGFEFLASESGAFTLINIEPITMESFGFIQMNIPITPQSKIPADGAVAEYLSSITIEPNAEGITLDESNPDNVLLISDMFVPDNVDPLPVNFLSFVASGNDCKVNLEWKTSNEMRTGSFAVERSHNGSDYTTLGVVRAIEAATATLDYTYTDAQPLNGTSFYRIRQMDLEGKSTFSQARMIYGDCGNATVRMYPNPAADYILVDGVEAGNQIVVYNVLGQVIISKEATAANERINLSEIAAGSYTLNVVKGKNIVFSGIVLKK